MDIGDFSGGTNQPSRWSRLFPWQAWPAILLCIALNGFVLCQIAIHNPNYLTDYRLNKNPDANHYVLLGHNILLRGEFSRCSSPPYVPDILRTPVYPLFAGGLDLVFGAVGIYVAQSVMHILSCVLLFHLVSPYLGRAIAGVAAALLGSDFALAISNFDAMSEMVYLFLTLASWVCLFPLLFGPSPDRSKYGRVISGAILLSLATLTRPVGLHVPFVMTFAVIASSVFGFSQKRALRYAIIMLAVYAIPVGGWIARNYAVFSVAHLSNADAVMLVYFSGAGAYQVEHGLTLDEAQSRIATEFDLPTPNVTNNHWIAAVPVAEIDGKVRNAKWAVLKRYPRSLVVSSIRGTVKASVSHNAASFAGKTGQEWHSPGMQSLIRMERDAFVHLAENGPLLSGVFVWQMLHIGLTVSLGGLGIAVLILKANSLNLAGFVLASLLLLAYFLLTVALVGSDAYYRSRIPHMPLLCLFAASSILAFGKGTLPVQQS